MEKLFNQLSQLDVGTVAKALLGQKLIRTLEDGTRLSGLIVETESYHQDDEASHSFGGRKTKRNEIMFGPSGVAYVYFTYGMHYCMNVVIGPKDHAAAVLIRALEPIEGVDVMRLNRGQDDIKQLCSGPAKLTQALNIDTNLNGNELTKPPLQIEAVKPVPDSQIITTTRVGISKAVDEPLRFYIKDSLFISKK